LYKLKKVKEKTEKLRRDGGKSHETEIIS